MINTAFDDFHPICLAGKGVETPETEATAEANFADDHPAEIVQTRPPKPPHHCARLKFANRSINMISSLSVIVAIAPAGKEGNVQKTPAVRAGQAM
jgi:hypothetical protein